MSANGEMKEQMDEQQRRKMEARGQQAALEMDDEKREFVEEILSSEIAIIERCGLENFLSSDFPLGNLDPVDISANRWEMWTIYMRIVREHPNQDDMIQGARDMKKYYDVDPSTTPTEPLSAAEKTAIRGILKAVHARMTRGEGGMQQEMFQTNVSESRVVRPDDDRDGGGLKGLFS